MKILNGCKIHSGVSAVQAGRGHFAQLQVITAKILLLNRVLLGHLASQTRTPIGKLSNAFVHTVKLVLIAKKVNVESSYFNSIK